MCVRNDAAIVVETVEARAGAEMSFIPDGKFHRQRRGHARFPAAVSKSGPQVKRLKIFRILEGRRRFAGRFKNMSPPGQASDPVERNFLRRIKTMIKRGGN